MPPRRSEVFERLAGAYVGGRYAAALDGEHRPQPAGRDRLHSALVALDIHSHRVPAYDPTPANVTLVARTQAHVMTTTSLVLHAGATTGALSAAGTDRCQPALDAAQTAWADAATTWDRLNGPGPRRTDPDLFAAATEVHAAVAEITHDGATLATPATIAARVNVSEVAHVLQHAGAAAVDVAHVLRDTTEGAPMQVPARAALVAFAAAQAQIDPEQVRPCRDGPEQLSSPVDPRALLRNGDVALPGPVRDHLQATAALAVTAAGAVMSATAALDLGATSRLPRPPASPPHALHPAVTHVQSALPLPGLGWAR